MIPILISIVAPCVALTKYGVERPLRNGNHD